MSRNNHLEMFLELNARAFERGISSAGNSVRGVGTTVRRAASSMRSDLNVLQAPLRGLSGTVARLGIAFGAMFSAQKFIAVAEEYAGIDARLKLVTKSSLELQQVQQELYELSQRTGTGYVTNAAIYTKLAFALKATGVKSRELLGINEALAKSLIVGGANAAESSSFLLQFGQAMGSGVLQGEEFRAMMESNAYFGQQLAEALHTDIAGLRAMSKQGLLTTAAIREAVPGMLQQINRDFGQMPLTIGRAMTMLGNAFGKIVNGSNKAGGATGKIATVIREFVDYLDTHGQQIEDFIVQLINIGTETLKTAWEWRGLIAAFGGTVIIASVLANMFTAVTALIGGFRALLGLNIVSWGAGVITTLRSIQVAALTTAGALGAAGLLTLALVGGYALGKKIDEWEYFSDVVEANKDGLAEVPAKFKAISEATGLTIRSFEDLDRAEKKGLITFNQVTDAWEKVTGTAKKSATAQTKAQKSATEAMKKAYKSYAETVKKLQEDIAGRERSLAEQLRAMGRTGMSDMSAWKDRKKEAEEFASAAKKAADAAKKAFAAGDEKEGAAKIKEAVALYDKARNAAAELNTEISAGDKVIQTQAQSLKIAKGLVEDYGQAGIDIQKSYQEAIKTSAKALDDQSGGKLAEEMPDVAKAFADVSAQADGLIKKSAEFTGGWNDAWDDFLKDGNGAISQLETRLNQLTKDRNIKVYVKEVSKKALGGAIGTVQKLAAGGAVAWRNMLAGGSLPGFGGGDRRPIIGEDGEYMLNKFSVRDAGLAAATFFNNRNWGALIRELIGRFGLNMSDVVQRSGGGIINSIQVLPGLTGIQTNNHNNDGKGTNTYNVNLNFTGDVSAPSRQNARELARMVMGELQKLHRGSS